MFTRPLRKRCGSRSPPVLQRDTKVLRSGLRKAKLDKPWAISAAVARFLHTEEVTGSIPVWPTRKNTPESPVNKGFGGVILISEIIGNSRK